MLLIAVPHAIRPPVDVAVDVTPVAKLQNVLLRGPAAAGAMQVSATGSALSIAGISDSGRGASGKRLSLVLPEIDGCRRRAATCSLPALLRDARTVELRSPTPLVVVLEGAKAASASLIVASTGLDLSASASRQSLEVRCSRPFGRVSLIVDDRVAAQLDCAAVRTRSAGLVIGPGIRLGLRPMTSLLMRMRASSATLTGRGGVVTTDGKALVYGSAAPSRLRISSNGSEGQQYVVAGSRLSGRRTLDGVTVSAVHAAHVRPAGQEEQVPTLLERWKELLLPLVGILAGWIFTTCADRFVGSDDASG